MKKIILFIAFASLILSVTAQDTLRVKTVKIYYGDIKNNNYIRIGELDGAVINTDTLPIITPELVVVNVSNDTFTSDVNFEQTLDFYLYADTGLLLMDHNVSPRYPIMSDLSPNDSISISFFVFPLLSIINVIKKEGIDFEQISYWKIITGISYTTKDGAYSEQVFYEGADTSVFYVRKGGVGVQETEQETNIAVYPNPTNGELQIISSALRNECIEIVDMTGRIVKRLNSPINNTINVSELQNGMYFIAIYSNGKRTIKKFVKQ
ncbi:MAG TPA: T9SS type A sorting domain-containing protein [Bacteroidales bacterium]|nr:T9SS type A sorting domain-containing protein [Bacteroidales bacterium]